MSQLAADQSNVERFWRCLGMICWTQVCSNPDTAVPKQWTGVKLSFWFGWNQLGLAFTAGLKIRSDSKQRRHSVITLSDIVMRKAKFKIWVFYSTSNQCGFSDHITTLGCRTLLHSGLLQLKVVGDMWLIYQYPRMVTLFFFFFMNIHFIILIYLKRILRHLQFPK